jgi:hypothetical protein
VIYNRSTTRFSTQSNKLSVCRFFLRRLTRCRYYLATPRRRARQNVSGLDFRDVRGLSEDPFCWLSYAGSRAGLVTPKPRAISLDGPRRTPWWRSAPKPRDADPTSGGGVSKSLGGPPWINRKAHSVGCCGGDRIGETNYPHVRVGLSDTRHPSHRQSESSRGER